MALEYSPPNTYPVLFRSEDRGSSELWFVESYVRAWWEQKPAQPITFNVQWVKLWRSISPPDGNCIHMVESGIVQKLLELLDRHVDEGNVTVQHAALSALRNLAIPGKTPKAFQAWLSILSMLCMTHRQFFNINFLSQVLSLHSFVFCGWGGRSWPM